jgi:ferredoxin/flavodoxin---NADP+ reductase
MSINRRQQAHTLLEKNKISASAFVLRFDRNEMEFNPGQSVSVGVWGSPARKEYSIYSSAHDPYLEILVKIVEGGKVSNALNALKPGAKLNVHGPGGFFVLKNQSDPVLFIATGTGISPFRSMLLTEPKLDYTLLHGVREPQDLYGSVYVPKQRYIPCVTSSDPVSTQPSTQPQYFLGRVTHYLQTMTFAEDLTIYLCGNCKMIYDAYDILREKGCKPSQIQTEVYF